VRMGKRESGPVSIEAPDQTNTANPKDTVPASFWSYLARIFQF
jgi:hypothetical protein